MLSPPAIPRNASRTQKQRPRQARWGGLAQPVRRARTQRGGGSARPQDYGSWNERPAHPPNGISCTPSHLDFSHLSQTGWVAHRPPAQREAISTGGYTPPAFRWRPRSHKQRSERGYSETYSPISRVGWLSFWQ